jgi:hypothetical protein
MKSKIVLSTLLSLSLLTVSCKKEEEESTSTTDAKPKEIIMPRVQPIPAQSTQPIVQNAPVQNQQPVANGNQAVTMTQTPVATKPGMNPPHGQPGHRCDIAVGAPLNSPKQAKTNGAAGNAIVQQVTPAATTTPSQTTTTAPAILDPNAAQTTTAPGMNPPHGQAGHVCSVAVGAPLPK